ncbi:MAG: hypothetical protein HYX71_12710 [Opitutae bacterium]|nr:hypothetical protein [Opitutae bacterium]
MKLLLSAQVRLAAGLLALGAVALAGGCQSVREQVMDRVQEREYFTPANVSAVPRLPATLRRVVLVPFWGGAAAPRETAAALQAVFVAELQKLARFEVVQLSREDCLRRFGAPEFASVAALPHDFLAALGRSFGADGVLFVDVTSYRGYRPLALGVRAKLAAIEDPRLLWSMDEVFSADEPAVANSVRHFYGDKSGPAVTPAEAWPGALQSPGKFAAYVAAATFHTLPPR